MVTTALKTTPGDAMTDSVTHAKADPIEREKPRKSSWFRGCWHGKMSWPVGVQGYSYQVCLCCGAMRLFDEKTFSAFGPFRYDLNALIAWEKSAKPRSHPATDGQLPLR